MGHGNRKPRKRNKIKKVVPKIEQDEFNEINTLQYEKIENRNCSGDSFDTITSTKCSNLSCLKRHSTGSNETLTSTCTSSVFEDSIKKEEPIITNLNNVIIPNNIQILQSTHNYPTNNFIPSIIKSNIEIQTPQNEMKIKQHKDSIHFPNQKSQDYKFFEKSRKSLFSYLVEELKSCTNDYSEETKNSNKTNNLYAEKYKRVLTFFKLPAELERFIFYGGLACTDAILHLVTYVPITIFTVLVRYFYNVCSLRKFKITYSELVCFYKVLLLVIGIMVTWVIEPSFLYHTIKSQTIMKLYIMYNMLEIGDRLLASFGQDVMDALYYSCMKNNHYSSHPQFSDMISSIPYFALAVIYIVLHVFLLLTQVTTLNVAFNSHNKALLIIMMSNNFIELKGTVFKKFEATNLFQISCADCRERLQLWFMCYIVMIRNFSSKIDFEQLIEMIPFALYIIGAEYLIDWMKHSFIIKFNHIQFDKTYKEYCTLLANDIVMAKIEGSSSHQGQHSAVDQICRRTGFSILPITVLVIAITVQAVYKIVAGPNVITIGLLTFLIFLEFKFISSILLSKYTKMYHNVTLNPNNGKPVPRTFSNTVIPSHVQILDPFEQQVRNKVEVKKVEK